LADVTSMLYIQAPCWRRPDTSISEAVQKTLTGLSEGGMYIDAVDDGPTQWRCNSWRSSDHSFTTASSGCFTGTTSSSRPQSSPTRPPADAVNDAEWWTDLWPASTTAPGTG